MFQNVAYRATVYRMGLLPISNQMFPTKTHKCMHNNYIPLTGRAFEGSENFSAIRASTSGSRKLRLARGLQWSLTSFLEKSKQETTQWSLLLNTVQKLRWYIQYELYYARIYGHFWRPFFLPFGCGKLLELVRI